ASEALCVKTRSGCWPRYWALLISARPVAGRTPATVKLEPVFLCNPQEISMNKPLVHRKTRVQAHRATRTRTHRGLRERVRRAVALTVALTIPLLQSTAWAFCSDGSQFPANGYVIGQPPVVNAANWSPHVFTGTAGPVFVPDLSTHENNDPTQ